MTDVVQHALHVDDELRAKFTEAARLEHRSADQVLRELMQQYVAQVLRQQTDPATLALNEREKRSAAVRFAKSSVALEGLPVSSQCDDLTRDYINGDVTLDDAVKQILNAPRR